MVMNIFHGIFMVCEKNQLYTMNFINAVFMAMKIKITGFSWLFNNFLIEVGFIVSACENTFTDAVCKMGSPSINGLLVERSQ